jgi:putative FmdB family regulatory protein
MPTYEYECMECKMRFDVFQAITDDPIEKCMKCNGKVRKIFGKAGIIFKGSGFYTTDYKNKSNGSGESQPSGKTETPPSDSEA